jgi:flagellar protein FliO/FliZ
VTGLGIQSLLAVIVVLGLVAALAWMLRRGGLASLRPGGRSIAVETAVPLGERRSLVIVAVEGRRLLLGMTPGQISMVTELEAVTPAPDAPPAPGGGNQSFEQLLVARARDMFTRRNPPAGPPSQSFGGVRLQPDLAETCPAGSPAGALQPATQLRLLAGWQGLRARCARLARRAVGQGAHDYRLCPHNALSVQQS